MGLTDFVSEIKRVENQSDFGFIVKNIIGEGEPTETNDLGHILLRNNSKCCQRLYNN